MLISIIIPVGIWKLRVNFFHNVALSSSGRTPDFQSEDRVSITRSADLRCRVYKIIVNNEYTGMQLLKNFGVV